ncbi:MAG: DUF3419 family protein [Bdellovibrionales bacterium]|nr:DUF3419 family protein [Bdellovibrionales bacterium]
MSHSLTRENLRKAVLQSPASKRTGLLERLFTIWFDGLVYNQIWEDPVVDAEALELSSASRILAISSGGCNLLNYLLYDPERIEAVDLNKHHMHLTRLKLMALKTLPNYESFFSFFGVASGEQNVANYNKFIRPQLDQESREYWEQISPLRIFGAKRRIHYFRNNLYNYSRSGYFLRFLHSLCRVTKCDTSKLLLAKTPEEQVELFDRYLAPSFDHWIVRALGKVPVILFSLGIPPKQFESLCEGQAEKIVQIYRDRLRRLACNFPIQENYFAWQAFGRRYNLKNQDALPDYLKRQNYELVRSRCERISTHIISLTEFLRQQPEKSLNRFIFLDSQDWMTHQQIDELWGEVARVGEAGSRIIFRTASDESPVETALTERVREFFRYAERESRDFYERDRSAVYGGFHLYQAAQ